MNKYQKAVQEFSVPEDALPGHYIGTVISSRNGVSFCITDDAEVVDMFTIHHQSGKLYLLSPFLDFETTPEYSLAILLSAPDIDIATVVNVTIVVSDVIDERPVFSHYQYHISIDQITPTDTKVVQLSVSDRDQGDTLSLELISYRANSLGLFYLDHASRFITTSRDIDPGDVGLYDLIITASDRGGLTSYALVTINIEIEPNNLLESLNIVRDVIVIYPGDYYGVVAQIDLVSDQNIDKCTIHGPMHAYFELAEHWKVWQIGEINEISGSLSITCYAQEKINAIYTYTLIVATDVSDFSHTISRRQFSDVDNDTETYSNITESNSTISPVVPVVVIPELMLIVTHNGVEREFNGSSELPLIHFMSENEPVLMRLHLEPNDSPLPADYSCSNHLIMLAEIDVPFEINRNGSCDFVLSNNEVLDYEEGAQYYSLSLMTYYAGELLSAVAFIQIVVNDVNDHSPHFAANLLHIAFKENYIGEIGEIQATDNDLSVEYSELTYSLSGDTRFSIDNTGVIRCLEEFDYEQPERCFSLTISAVDVDGNEGVTSVEVCVLDQDDNCPRFTHDTYELSFVENIPNNIVLYRFRATDADTSLAFQSVIVYSLSPVDIQSYLSINSETGELFSVNSFDYESDPTTLSFSVVAIDIGNNECSAQVTITILNEKDMEPVFTSPEYQQIQIPEETFPVQLPGKPQNVIACVAAVDEEGDDITFSLVESYEMFELNSTENNKACLTLIDKLDYETENRHIVQVSASDGVLTELKPVFIIVDVTNINDLELQVQQEYAISVEEGAHITEPILTLEVRDPDLSARYRFQLADTSPYFFVNSIGELSLVQPLDYEYIRRHDITVRVLDGRQQAYIYVTVIVLPVNEHPPEFRDHRIEVELDENEEAGSFEYVLETTDEDIDSEDIVMYDIVFTNGFTDNSENASKPFEIIQPIPGSNRGIVTNTQAFDYESGPPIYTLEIYPRDSVQRSNNALDLSILIQDINDVAPSFPQDTYTFVFSESISDASFQILATDSDASLLFRNIIYTLESLNNYSPPFFVGSSGLVFNTMRFDYETLPNEYHFMIIATDLGGLSDSANVSIFITDSNEFTPRFSSNIYEASIPETLEVGTEIIRVSAIDRDRGDNYGEVTYIYSTSNAVQENFPFEINSTTGSITLKEEIDFEAGQEGADFFVQAIDGGGRSADTRVYINIEDINDNPPCPLIRSISAQVIENDFNAQILRRIQTQDLDIIGLNPPVEYYMIPDYTQFRIDQRGRLIVAEPLDHEANPSFAFEVIVSDGIRNCSTSVDVMISVLNLDDNIPEFPLVRYTYNLSESTVPGVLFDVVAIDRDPPDTIVGYELIYDDLVLPFTVSALGSVSNTRYIDADDPAQQLQYFFEVLAFNQYGQGSEQNADITINIIDVNDIYPVFEFSEYNISLYENHNSTLLAALQATDLDRSPQFHMLHYRLQAESSEIESMFEIFNNGSVVINSMLDYETTEYLDFTLLIIASDGDHETNTTLHISLLDVNEHIPLFPQAHYSINIPLDISTNTTIFQFNATDQDRSMEYGTVDHYTLIRNSHLVIGPFPFSLNPTGRLYTIVSGTDMLEVEYTFQVTAHDRGNLTTAPVDVTVSFNDEEIGFHQTKHCIYIIENSVIEEPIIDLSLYENRATDIYTYQVHESSESYLRLQGTQAYVTRALDFEQNSNLAGVIIAINRLGRQIPITLSLCLQNVNDNPTNFATGRYSIVITKNMRVGTLLEIPLEDADNNIPVSDVRNCCQYIEPLQPSLIFISTHPAAPFHLEHVPLNNTALLSNTIPPIQFSSCTYLFQVTIEDSDDYRSRLPLTMDIQLKLEPQVEPRFSKAGYTFTFRENERTNFSVFAENVAAMNPCMDPSLSAVRYTLQSADFEVNDDGIIYSNMSFDYEQSQQTFSFNITAINEAELSSTIPVVIYLQDINEFCPELVNNASLTLSISENNVLNDIIVENIAFDRDGGHLYGALSYAISPPEHVPFHINTNGSLVLSEDIDYESGVNEYAFQILVNDGSAMDMSSGDNGLVCNTVMMAIHIIVEDENDEMPFYNQHIYRFSIRENQQVGVFPERRLGRLLFFDSDVQGNNFEFTTIPSTVPFFIDTSGWVYMTNTPDFERSQQFVFSVRLSDGIQEANQLANVTVDIINENEYPPTFEQEFTATLPENSVPETGIKAVVVSDRDIGEFGEIVLWELQGEEVHLFNIDQSGVIRNVEAFDYETDLLTYVLVVTATDGGGKNASTSVFVTLEDVNDHSPVFIESENNFTISESAAENTRIVTLHATDGDGSSLLSTITYEIPTQQPCSHLFTMHPHTGILQVATELDYEFGPTECQVQVQAVDAGSLYDTTVVYINILDANEFLPFIPSKDGLLSIMVPQGTPVGTPFYTVEAVDFDGGDVYGSIANFSLITTAEETKRIPFRISSFGELIVTHPLHKGDVFIFYLRVIDGGGLQSGNIRVQVNITESNDHPPVIAPPLNVVLHLHENQLPSRPIHSLHASDADGNDLSFLVMSGNPDMIRFVQGIAETMEVWLAAGFDYEVVQQYIFSIAVTDGFFISEYLTIHINILPINEHSPVFVQSYQEVEIYENIPPFSFQLPLMATDLDKITENSTHGVITQYSLLYPSPYFTIHQSETSSYILTNVRSFDFELMSNQLNVSVQAMDGGGLVSINALHVVINLLDTNDEAPHFSQSEYVVEIMENIMGIALHAVATDNDKSSRFQHSLIPTHEL